MAEQEEKPKRLFAQLEPRPRAGFPAGARAIMLVLAVAVAAILARVMKVPETAPAVPAASAKPALPKVIRVEVVTPPSAAPSP